MAVYKSATPPKVLCILSWYTSYKIHGTDFGGTHFFTEHMKSIQKYCDVAAYVPFETDTSSELNDEEEWGIRTFRYKFPDWYLKLSEKKLFKLLKKLQVLNLYRAIHFVRGFRKVYKQFKPDVIQAQAADHAGKFSVLFLRSYGIPVVITEHNMVMKFRGKALSPLRKLVYYITYKLAQKNICVSKGQQEVFSKYFKGIDFSVIYNGIYDRPVDPSAGKYRRENFINCAIVAGFSSLTVKGFHLLLPAIKILVQELHIPIMLHLCGGGTYLEHFKNLAEELQITDNCIFHGSCTKQEVYSVVSEMDFGVSASLFESAGVNVEEMLLLGKPVVVTKSGGANSLVTDFSAIVVEKGSTEALVEGIREMSERYRDFDSKAIREYALENFESDNTARKYIQIYQELADKYSH